MEKDIIRIYKNEELQVLNEMFKKDKNNKTFTYEELEFANKFDLTDKPIAKIAGIVWKYRNNKKALLQIKKMLEQNEINEFNNVLGGNV